MYIYIYIYICIYIYTCYWNIDDLPWDLRGHYFQANPNLFIFRLDNCDDSQYRPIFEKGSSDRSSYKIEVAKSMWS
jgi:hypothetical protein